MWYVLNKLEKLGPTEQNEISIEFPVHELLSQRSHTNSVSQICNSNVESGLSLFGNKLAFI